MSSRRSIYVTLFGIAAAAAFTKVLGFASLLGPQGFGLFSLALLIVNAVSYLATAGILEAMVREVPILRGTQTDPVNFRSHALSGVLFLACIVGLLSSLFCALIAFDRESLQALIWTGPLLIATVGVNALLCDLQVRELSIEYAVILCLKSLFALSLGWPLSKLGGVNGVLAAEVIALLACISICLLRWCRDVRWRFIPDKSVSHMMQVGMPFAVSNLLQNLAMSIDRWAVQLTLGVAALGTYAFAMHFVSVGLVLLNMVHLYASPRVLRDFGASSDISRVALTTSKLAWRTLLAFTIGAIPIVVLFPGLVQRWFPQFADAASLVVWVYIGTAAITLGFYDILFRATGNGRPLVTIQAGVAGIAIVLCVAGSIMGVGMVFYAMVFAAARVLATAAGWWMGLRRVRIHSTYA